MKRLLAASLLCFFAIQSAAADTKGEYDGLCAYGLTTNKSEKTDCKINWEDPSTKKVYCFTTEEHKKEWAKDTAGNVIKADAGYKVVSAMAAANKHLDDAKKTTDAMAKSGDAAQAAAAAQANAALNDATKKMNAGIAGVPGTK